MSAVTREWLGLNRLPNMQRTAAVGMILIQNLLLMQLMASPPMPVSVIALAGWFAPQFGLLIRLPVPVSFLTLAAGFVILTRTSETDFTSMGFIGTDVAFHMSCCCLSMQLLMLFLKQYAERLPIWMLAISSAGIVLSGDIRVSGSTRSVVLVLNAAYLVLWAVFAASSRERVPVQVRRGRWIRAVTLVVLMAGSLFAGRQLAIALHRHENQLERVISQLLFARQQTRFRHGFSGGGGLTDVSGMKFVGGDEIALLITSDVKPDYLRGKAFDQFLRNQWGTTGATQTVVPRSILRDEAMEITGRKEFFIGPETNQPLNLMQVVPVGRRSRQFCFSPLGTARMECDSSLLKVDPNGIIERLLDEGTSTYNLWAGEPPRVPYSEIDPRYLQLPAQLGPTVKSLAASLMEGKTTSREKMLAVSEFFQNEFEYGLGIELPRGVNRLEFFLTHRVPAHCEYFATATALILRLQGVPTRYVTGYVVNGQNPLVGEWVARHRDAHAWVEAYDEDLQQWVTVESTPPSGIPTSDPGTQWMQIRDALQSWWRHLSDLSTTPGIWQKVIKFAFGLLVTITLGAIGVVVLRTRRSSDPTKGYEARWAVPLSRERVILDRYLSRRGLTRRKSETLLHFARRVEGSEKLQNSNEFAGWYRDYAQLRFDMIDRDEMEMLEQMRTRRKKLIRRTKVVS